MDFCAVELDVFHDTCVVANESDVVIVGVVAMEAVYELVVAVEYAVERREDVADGPYIAVRRACDVVGNFEMYVLESVDAGVTLVIAAEVDSLAEFAEVVVGADEQRLVGCA